MSPMGVVPVFIPPALPHAHGVPDPMAEVYTGGAQVPQPHQACYEAGTLVFFARLAAAACGTQVADLSPSDARACTDPRAERFSRLGRIRTLYYGLHLWWAKLVLARSRAPRVP